MPDTLFKPGENCWRTTKADKATLLIDCEAYYSALYHAISRAKRSIFVLGWDIDGRIELLRGEDAKNANFPVRFFDLIKFKTDENPELKVYLNRWNYSIFFMSEREPMSGWRWNRETSSNVYYCTDYKIPFSGCHHQKLISVDDEVAFCGGMDVALGRWDQRQHHVNVEDRKDPGGITRPVKKKPYMPYHDIQIIVDGPIVKDLGELVRWRWKRAAGFDAVPFEEAMPGQSETAWPTNIKPHFTDINIAIARTFPKTQHQETIHEIEEMYLAEIGRAERFIYIENQYLTSERIAKAINQRLKDNSGLKVLIVSGDHPRGFMEHHAMWTGRVKFCDIVEDGTDKSRFAVTYPVSREDGKDQTYHIHSKIMIIDDRYLHIGSSNLNKRSMGFDSECDLILDGDDEAKRDAISSIRNNLIREHTGREESDINRMINDSTPLNELLIYQNHSRQHLICIDNDPYRNELLTPLAIKLGDPKKAHFLHNIPVRQVLTAVLILGLLGTLAWSWFEPYFSEFFSEESIKAFIQNARDSQFSLLWIAGIYIIAGLVFFPVTVLNLTTAIVFGPLYGLLMALFGSLSSASLSYVIGRILGKKSFKLFRPIMEKIQHYAKRGGIIGMTLIRLVPIAPFTLVNITFGLTRIDFKSYIIATVLGLIPGIFAKAMLGGAIAQLWEDPEPKVIFYTAGSIFLWIFIIWGSHRVFRHYKGEMGI